MEFDYNWIKPNCIKHTHFPLSVHPSLQMLNCFPICLTVSSSPLWGGNYLYGQCQLIIDLVITRFPLRLRQLIYKANAKGEVLLVSYPWLIANLTLLDSPLYSANSFSTQQTLKHKYHLSPRRMELTEQLKLWWQAVETFSLLTTQSNKTPIASCCNKPFLCFEVSVVFWNMTTCILASKTLLYSTF